MSCELVAEFEAEAKEFVAAQFAHVTSFSEHDRALAWMQDDGEYIRMMGGVVLSPRGGGFDAELSIAMAPGCQVTRKHIRALFSVAFQAFGLKRLTCHIARKNRRARSFVERLGFRHEGSLKRGYDGTQTACVYGMTIDDCRWIDG